MCVLGACVMRVLCVMVGPCCQPQGAPARRGTGAAARCMPQFKMLRCGCCCCMLRLLLPHVPPLRVLPLRKCCPAALQRVLAPVRTLVCGDAPPLRHGAL